MKRVLIGLGILALLALDWAAAHDILKGNEADYRAEWTMLASSLVLLPLLVRAWKGRVVHS